MIPAAHLRALRALCAVLAPEEGLVWALTGSTAFALRGMDLTPHDIDLIADRSGAYRIGGLLGDRCLRPVSPSWTRYVRSHFGQFVVEGVQVDVMGDSSYLGFGGGWTAPAPLPPIIETLESKGLRLPVLTLAREAAAYRLLRRDARVEMIEAHLRAQGNPPRPDVQLRAAGGSSAPETTRRRPKNGLKVL